MQVKNQMIFEQREKIEQLFKEQDDLSNSDQNKNDKVNPKYQKLKSIKGLKFNSFLDSVLI